ncbi:MAG: hypothetical protein P1U33_06970 [Litorivicinaceae bacterium]|nr:hypothetical protein [Litorivicinaceae bacterium]
MLLPVSNPLGSEQGSQSVARTIQATYGRPVTIMSSGLSYQLHYDAAKQTVVLKVSGSESNQQVQVSANRDLVALLTKYGDLSLTPVRSGAGHVPVLKGLVPTPTPTQILLLYETTKSSVMRESRADGQMGPAMRSHPMLAAMHPIDARGVSRMLTQQPSSALGFPLASPQPSPLENSDQLVRSVIASVSAEQGNKKMLIPDINPAMPRPIAPDALPNSVPITQPIAAELGLKSGQVVQALVSSAGDKMALQLNNRDIPLPPGMRLPEGQVTLRVAQGQQGLVLLFNQAPATPASQAAAVGGLSATLAEILAKPSSKSQISSVFSPRTLETLLSGQGLDREAVRLQNQRLDSNNLNAQAIARGVQFGGLNTERALLEGISLSAQTLKPWLRQILRLLPAQSELTTRIGELIGDLERFQLDSIPSSTSREYSGFASLLLFRDQPPVELIFERFQSVDDERHSSWVINLHTSLEHLGEIWLKSTFSQSNVELVMWAVEKKTAELAKEGSLDLQEAFSELGLTMQSFQILNSERTNFPERSIPTHSNLDLEA